MWSPEPSNFGGLHDASIFALAAWHELFDAFTPDTFQPRIHNVASLAEELGDVAFRIDDSTKWWRHLHTIREELVRTAEEEQDILGPLPEYRWLLEEIHKTDDPRKIHLTCALVSQRRSEYSDALLPQFDNQAMNF